MCDRVFGPPDADEFLSGVDFLILAMPITPATTGIVGEKQLRRLKSSAVLINPARAPLVNLADFTRCMREGWIRAAAFDVHYAYPLPADHPMWSMPNAILTPHISGSVASPHVLERVFDIFCRNVRRWIDGAPMLNELSAAQLRGE
jgi:phosphoglycerate dehydrogenase-like enzyme